jgi:hypothetical protein
MGATDELINGVVTCSRIPSVKRRQEIQRELRAHMEDFAATARGAGHQEDEIETLLRSHFGDPEEVAEEFAWVYRHERRRLLLVSYAASTVLVAGSLLLAILAIQSGLAAGFGTSILEMLASRHTVIEGLDVLGCVAVYLAVTSLETLFEGYRFQKAVLLVAGLTAALIVGCAAMSLHTTFLFYGLITGVFLRAVRLFVRKKIVRASVVPICFGCAGLAFGLLRSPISAAGVEATCASWLALGAGYLVMTDIAPRVESTFLNALQRI